MSPSRDHSCRHRRLGVRALARRRSTRPGLVQARELSHASRQVTAIEINGTFYGAQKPASFRRWHDETPDDFVFSVKGPRFVTHRRDLATAGPSIDRFFASGVLELGAKLGPILWQFAPFMRFDEAAFAAFLALLPREIDGRALRHVVEVRHPSFGSPAFIELLRRHKIAVALVDDEKYPAITDDHRRFRLCTAAPLRCRRASRLFADSARRLGRARPRVVRRRPRLLHLFHQWRQNPRPGCRHFAAGAAFPVNPPTHRPGPTIQRGPASAAILLAKKVSMNGDACPSQRRGARTRPHLGGRLSALDNRCRNWLRPWT